MACVECGDDDPAEGWDMCSDCIEAGDLNPTPVSPSPA